MHTTVKKDRENINLNNFKAYAAGFQLFLASSSSQLTKNFLGQQKSWKSEASTINI
jgi:hypothetical protein